MFFRFPPDTVAVGRLHYERPYDDPIAVEAGDTVQLDEEESQSSDIVGWVWCRGPDGRGGWTPQAWLERCGDSWTIRRDFSALELDVEPGDRFLLHYAESGFLYVENARGVKGWVPDGAVEMAAT